jgi:selenocysteine-specific translation elongation factor
MKRGYIICDPESVKTGTKIKLSFEKNRFYKGDIRENLFHVTVGMQTFPVKIIDVGEDMVTIESEKPLVYSLEDIFLLMDINADKLHIVGRGKPVGVS